MKLWVKKTCCMFMVAAMLIVTSYRTVPPLQVHALGPAAMTAWEVLQWILVSVGVTVTGYELVDSIAPENWKENLVNTVTDNLNGFKEDLGNKIKLAAGAVVGVTSASAVLARETWQDLKSWSDSLFTSSSEATISDRYTAITAIAQYSDLTQLIENIYGYTVSPSINSLSDIYNSAEKNGSSLTCVGISEREGKIVLYFFYSDTPGLVLHPVLTSINDNLTITFSDNKFHYGNISKSLSAGRFNGGSFSSFAIASSYNLLSNVSTFPDLSVTVPIIGSQYVGVDTKVKIRVDPGFRAETIDDALTIVTPGTTYEDGVLAGDVVLPIPADLTDILGDIADGVLTIPDALADVDVYPVADNDQAITDAMDKVAAGTQNPSIDRYRLPLADFFPFCLPFDFYDFLQVLKADPVAPEVTFSLPVGYSLSGGVTYQDYTISLAMFDTVAYWFRQFELLAFIIGLIMITRSMFIRS